MELDKSLPSPLPGFRWYMPYGLLDRPNDCDWNLWSASDGHTAVWVRRVDNGFRLGGWVAGTLDPEALQTAIRNWPEPPQVFPTAKAVIDWVNFRLELES